MKITDLESLGRIPKVLLYGPAGSGKTAFAGTGGEHVRFYDFDNGVQTCLRLKDQWYDTRRKVDVKQFLEPDPGRAVAWTQGKSKILDDLREAAKKTPGTPSIFAFDSYTSLAESAVRATMQGYNRLGQAPQIQEWGHAFIEIENFLAQIRASTIAIVLIAHHQMKEIDDVTHIEIATPGAKLPNKIPAYFDEVWYAKVKNLSGGKLGFTIQTVKSGNVMARSRGGVPDGFDMNKGLLQAFKEGGYLLPPYIPAAQVAAPTSVPMAQPKVELSTPTVVPSVPLIKV